MRFRNQKVLYLIWVVLSFNPLTSNAGTTTSGLKVAIVNWMSHPVMFKVEGGNGTQSTPLLNPGEQSVISNITFKTSPKNLIEIYATGTSSDNQSDSQLTIQWHDNEKYYELMSDMGSNANDLWRILFPPNAPVFNSIEWGQPALSAGTYGGQLEWMMCTENGTVNVASWLDVAGKTTNQYDFPSQQQALWFIYGSFAHVAQPMDAKDLDLNSSSYPYNSGTELYVVTGGSTITVPASSVFPEDGQFGTKLKVKIGNRTAVVSRLDRSTAKILVPPLEENIYPLWISDNYHSSKANIQVKVKGPEITHAQWFGKTLVLSGLLFGPSPKVILDGKPRQPYEIRFSRALGTSELRFKNVSDKPSVISISNKAGSASFQP